MTEYQISCLGKSRFTTRRDAKHRASQAKHEGARILIHAGAQPDKNAIVYGDHLDVYKAIVAIATLTGCHYSEDGTCCGPWGFENTYHWTLTDITALPEPVPAKGAFGFWTPDEEITNAALRQDTEVAW